MHKIPPFCVSAKVRIVPDSVLAREIQERWYRLGYPKARVWTEDVLVKIPEEKVVVGDDGFEAVIIEEKTIRSSAIRSNLVNGIPPR